MNIEYELIAIGCFIFGGLAIYVYIKGRLNDVKRKVEHEQRLREYIIDKQVRMFKLILEDMDRRMGKEG